MPIYWKVWLELPGTLIDPMRSKPLLMFIKIGFGLTEYDPLLRGEIGQGFPVNGLDYKALLLNMEVGDLTERRQLGPFLAQNLLLLLQLESHPLGREVRVIVAPQDRL